MPVNAVDHYDAQQSAPVPSLLLIFAILCLDSGDNASDCADKIHAHIAFDETGPIALAATPELHAITSVKPLYRLPHSSGLIL
nr:hypothetical protein [Caballeronia arvi]